MKSMNMDIWVVSTSNQLFMKGPYDKINFQKNNVISGETPFFVIDPFFSPHLIYLNIDCWQDSFLWKCYISNQSVFD